MIKLLSRKPTALRLVNPSAAKIKIFTASALDRKSGSAGMPRPISYAVFCLKKKIVRRLFVLRSEAALAAQPSDSKVLARWRVGYLLTYVLSEGIALSGVVLHFLGFALAQVTPFFLTGFVLLVFFRPRRASNELG